MRSADAAHRLAAGGGGGGERPAVAHADADALPLGAAYLARSHARGASATKKRLPEKGFRATAAPGSSAHPDPQGRFRRAHAVGRTEEMGVTPDAVLVVVVVVEGGGGGPDGRYRRYHATAKRTSELFSAVKKGGGREWLSCSGLHRAPAFEGRRKEMAAGGLARRRRFASLSD